MKYFRMWEMHYRPHYRPHSFDTHGFLTGVKVLVVLTIVLVGVRYGTVYASSILVREDEGDAAVAAVAATAASSPAPSPVPTSAPTVEKPHIQTTAAAPKVSAQAYIVADLDTGVAYASKDADTAHPIASISKLLVALAVRKTLTPETEVTVTKADRAQTEGSPGSIQRDETFTVTDLFYPLLMESNNSVAYALERAGGGDEFIRVMLRIAHDVGMDETLLNDSSGLSAKNSASARDLLLLAQHIATNEPELLEITRTTSKSVAAQSGRAYPIPNLNVFSKEDAFLGGKTGYTDEAKQTMLAIFEVPVKKSEKPARIAIIVLASSDRKGDIGKLRTWFERSAVFK